MIPDRIRIKSSVEQDDSARFRQSQQVITLKEAELVNADKARVFDQIRRRNRGRSKPQVRGGHRARLLRIVNEVGLGI